MQVEDKKEGNVLVVKILNNRLDAHGANEFKEKMSEYISNGNQLIVLNLSEVDFVDSSGLGAMVSVLKMLGENAQLAVCNVTEQVERLFKLTRMNKVFNMFGSEREAIDVLSD